MSRPQHPETSGKTSLALCGDGTHSLLRVNANVPAVMALEYASTLQGCANRLLLDLAHGEIAPHAIWPALYLNEITQAIVDDLAIAASS